MKKNLINLGFEDNEAMEKALVLPINDMNYFIELYSSQKPPPLQSQWQLS